VHLDTLEDMIRNVVIFCSSANGVRATYREAANQLGRTLANLQIGIIHGGANVGLMQAIAESALSAGGKVFGVIPGVLVDLEVAHCGVTE
jgi:predicted Rossmann-fold nucleotide-binding protein